MAYQIATASTTVRINAASAAHGALFNGGYIDIYTTAQATNPQTAIGAQTKLARLMLANPAFGSPSAGVVTANPIAASAAIASGTAVWYRALKSDGTTVIEDGTVSSSSGTLVLDNVTVNNGLDVTITAFTHTEA